MELESEFAAAQARCDAVDQAHGLQAPRWLQAETLTQYRVRLLHRHQQHSRDWRSANLNVIAMDPKALEVAEARIYADSYHAAMNPSNTPGSPLIARTTRDATGRMVTRFFGDPIEAWKPYMGAGVRYLTGIERHPAG
jgi:hypothetical protein